MKFLKDYQNNLKSKCCDHLLIVLEEKHGRFLQKCTRCFRLSESVDY
ncbi:MAG: hypothetical protein HOD60_11245 [Candidatus Nitrosopelagicus sp.]|nr:hypothetical protein [Candidatus Nitrosopelagicus sp.]